MQILDLILGAAARTGEDASDWLYKTRGSEIRPGALKWDRLFATCSCRDDCVK